jgi:hypothetical protein
LTILGDYRRFANDNTFDDKIAHNRLKGALVICNGREGAENYRRLSSAKWSNVFIDLSNILLK